MLPSSASSRSYTQQKRKVDGRRQPVARSSSFLGTIKNLVTAPLSWFSQDDDDFEDANGKRRRAGQSDEARELVDEGEKRVKRMRISSPPRQDQPGYLDPPGRIFQQPRSAPPGTLSFPPLTSRGHPSPIQRSTSVAAPSLSVQRHPRNNRHTVSPNRTSFGQADAMSRTMSMDPPARIFPTNGAALSPSRDRHRYSVSMSIPREASTSPTRSLFRMRTSLTPQPSGPNFGPSIPQRREATEPPTLEQLAANPIFVRPPPEHSKSKNATNDSKTTLGSLADSQRSSRPPVRQHSALLFGGSQGSSSHNNALEINAAEKALHELDIYKTPLLPTRLRGSSTIPDMFKPKPKRSNTPILMQDHDDKPRLGRAKGKDAVNGTKPYAGEGGMKKMLARRRMEAAEEKRQERADAMEDDLSNEDTSEPLKSNPAQEEQKRQMPPSLFTAPKFDASVDRNASREQSSLRVGRTRTHISRPTSRPHNRFSAAYEEEESEEGMWQEKSSEQIALEESAKKAPIFSVPAGFSFAKEAPAIQHDLSAAKEPPMTALPFSLTQSASVTPSKSTGDAQKPAAMPSFFAQPPPTPSVALLAPSISLTAPTPEQSKMAPAEASMPSSVPNFFANSPSFSKPISVTPPVITTSGIPNFFGNSVALSKPVVEAKPAATNGSVPNFFGNLGTSNKPEEAASSNESPSFFSNSPAVNKTVAQSPSPASFSFGSPAHVTPTTDTENPLWEGETKKAEQPAPQSQPMLFGDSSKTTTPSALFGGSNSGSVSSSTSPPFGQSAGLASVKEEPMTIPLFGFPKVIESVATPAPTPIAFGAPANQAALPTSQAHAEPPKPTPLFGTAPVSSFAGFGGQSPANAAESVKPKFSFGQPAPNAAATVEAPKPQFPAEASGGFLFGQRASSVDARPSSLSPFSFGASPATPPAGAEKAAFSFGSSPAPAPPMAPSFSFGAPTGSSNGADVSHRPFAFGNAGATPQRPVTPPQNDYEFKMEESPTREITRPSETPKPDLGGFSFGAPSASAPSAPFGQTTQGGSGPFAFGNAQPASNPFAAKPEEKAEAKSSGFSFGQAPAPASLGFGFGQNTPEPSPVAPMSGFSFGQQPAAPLQIATSNSFGGFAAPSAANPFSSAASNAGTAPSSPSTFNQPTPFGFASPATASNPFAFGSSQPASPAPNGNTSLPPAPGTPSGGGFSFGGGTNSQTTSPFQQAAPPLPPAGGGLFTIGSAPPPPAGGAGRQMKKLPARRGAGKKL